MERSCPHVTAAMYRCITRSRIYRSTVQRSGHTSDLVIPQTIGGRKVMDIDKYVFNGDTTIKKLLLPYGMTTVSAYAFYGCYNLEELTLL